MGWHHREQAHSYRGLGFFSWNAVTVGVSLLAIAICQTPL
ncbi:hypothetical protein M2426_000393 [Pseudomonas moraviensis]